jgi:hypothetical protein
LGAELVRCALVQIETLALSLACARCGREEVSHLCACIGSPCLRQCVHGAPIGRRRLALGAVGGRERGAALVRAPAAIVNAVAPPACPCDRGWFGC